MILFFFIESNSNAITLLKCIDTLLKCIDTLLKCDRITYMRIKVKFKSFALVVVVVVVVIGAF